jgi:hypothetical protein
VIKESEPTRLIVAEMGDEGLNEEKLFSGGTKCNVDMHSYLQTMFDTAVPGSTREHPHGIEP